ncbi:MAG TPA: YaiO family outer membrane beta-barrel protein, partial [Longimicrobium sp.]|nr:YaiO family outer membrane beta-barrel protein [Longimicrobium sp.]
MTRAMGLAAAALLWAAPAAAQERVRPTTRVMVEAGYVGTDYGFGEGPLASLAVARRGSGGALLGRLSYANRFREDAFQAEVEAYPRLARRAYAYAAAGVGTGGAFPLRRAAAEAFVGFGPGWEASAGFRAMDYGESAVEIYTASLGRYVGNWWGAGRVYVSPALQGHDRAGEAALRRY